MAGFWIESAEGEKLTRTVGPSPQHLELEVSRADVRAGTRFLLRFSPTTSRGRLSGQLIVAAPPETRRPAPETIVPPGPAPLQGRAACLQSLLDGGAASREIEAFARLYAEVGQEDATWALRWVRSLREALEEDISLRARRSKLDALWEQLRLDAPPHEAIGSAYRRMLAAAEDLVRREEGAREPEKWSARRMQIASGFACLEVPPGS